LKNNLEKKYLFINFDQTRIRKRRRKLDLKIDHRMDYNSSVFYEDIEGIFQIQQESSIINYLIFRREKEIK